MNFSSRETDISNISFTPVVEQSHAKTFMANVFLLMFIALGISAVFAWLFSNSIELLTYLVTATGGLTLLGNITLFAPLGFVLLMSFGYRNFSATVLLFLFIAYAIINGISFSFILLAFTPGSVLGCFLSASAMFGIMAIMGYTTHQDLTKFGRILIMGLIGTFAALIINYFLQSSQLDYIISIIGVMVFTGLTAYDVQKLKRIGEGLEYDNVSAADTKKVSVLGALNLYLDFINIFLFLLRMFGGRRN
ncbi:MAG: Bax inhibitor-1/YccA family protein [Ginsengibacter sp.]